MAWEIVFMLLILKIPLVYLCAVVWWAVKAEPEADEPPADPAAVREPPVPAPRWTSRMRAGRRLTPLGPTRRGGRRPLPRSASARAPMSVAPEVRR